MHDQRLACEQVPTDQSIVIETFIDELGDWRVVLLSPFGRRVHAPWAMALNARLRAETVDLDIVWSDDGIVLRIPQSQSPPQLNRFLLRSEEVEQAVIASLSQSSLFAARFRENAARALLLPRRFPGKRTPLWLQRRKSADLLKIAARFPEFPILLETYRECLKDVFDLPALVAIMHAIEMQQISVHTIRSYRPSPFAQALLFDFTAQFIYDADAPLAERRAQALALDHVQLKELLGTADYRQLLDPDLFEPLRRQLQQLDRKPLRSADEIHNLLLAIGDQSRCELARRVEAHALNRCLQTLLDARRVVETNIAGEVRIIAVEDSARYRDALGSPLPRGLPAALLEPVAAPVEDLLSRYARTHPPFTEQELCTRLGLAPAIARQTLIRLSDAGRVSEGQFTPDSQASEWVDSQVLGVLKRRSLARWRQQIEPVSQQRFAQFLPTWQHLTRAEDRLRRAARRCRAAAGLCDARKRDGEPNPARASSRLHASHVG